MNMKTMDINYVRILNFGPIKISGIGKEFRHVTIQDLNNEKSVDYIIFKEKHQFMWEDTKQEKLPEVAYYGEIISLKITKDLLTKITSVFPLTIKEGDIVDLIIWYWDGWDQLSEEARIAKSLQDQIWRFRSLPKEHYRKDNDESFEDDREYDNSNDWERDYFDAMTDGMLGDYEDFKGDIDDIQTWSRG